MFEQSNKSVNSLTTITDCCLIFRPSSDWAGRTCWRGARSCRQTCPRSWWGRSPRGRTGCCWSSRWCRCPSTSRSPSASLPSAWRPPAGSAVSAGSQSLRDPRWSQRGRGPQTRRIPRPESPRLQRSRVWRKACWCSIWWISLNYLSLLPPYVSELSGDPPNNPISENTKECLISCWNFVCGLL